MQGPAHRLDDTALDLVPDAIGVDGLTAVDGRYSTDRPHATGLVLDVDLDGDGTVGRQVLVPGEGEATTTPLWQLGPRLPSEPFGGALDDVLRALVSKMLEAEGNRIGTCRRRQLIQEALDGEHVGIGAETAQCRDPDPLMRNEVIDEVQIWNAIKRD